MAGRDRNWTGQVTLSNGRALVLGGLGFIGAHVVARLYQSGWTVDVVDNLEARTRETDQRIDFVSERARVHKTGLENASVVGDLIRSVDAVFDAAGATGHLASAVDPAHDIASNLTEHVSFFEVLRRIRPEIPVVNLSTRQVIGQQEDGFLTDRTCPKPVDVNGVSHLAREHYLRVCGNSWGLRSITLRLPNVYGPLMWTEDASHGVIGGWIGQALRGRPLKVLGSGALLRDVLFVADAAEAITRAVTIASVQGPSYLVGGNVMSLTAMAQTIGRMTGVPVGYAKLPPELHGIAVGSAVVDDGNFRSQSGWRPKVSFEDGLRLTLSTLQGRR